MEEDAASGCDGVGAASKARAAAFEEWEAGIGDGCTVVRKVTDAPSEECVAGSVIAFVEMVIRWTKWEENRPLSVVFAIPCTGDTPLCIFAIRYT
jgi:hypothetical protein